MEELFLEAPNENYKKLFDRFKNISNMDVNDWKKPEVLGYFCKKYFDYYNTNYKFKFNSPTPSKCFEVWQISSLGSKLSTQPKILKEYIDWMFDNYVPKAKRKITSISFLNKENAVNYYKFNILLADQPALKNNLKISRATELPLKFKELLCRFDIKISNYGELAFLFNANDGSDDKISKAIKSLVDELGFDTNLIKEII